MGVLDLMKTLQHNDIIDFSNSIESSTHYLLGPKGKQSMTVIKCPKCNELAIKSGNAYVHMMKVIKTQTQIGFDPYIKCELEEITNDK